ncbi:MAG: hypothetical protein EAZ31_06250 [Cytophagia bacterium]|nr:MAG: hypothetical protein EAY69_08260 [Cytophagales bacterium]TAG42363.1 MAG: hypothetical protein EAZ31_06250 [Cytophagia bacterium]
MTNIIHQFGFGKNAFFQKKFWLFLIIVSIISILTISWQIITFINKYHLRGKRVVKFKHIQAY